MSPLIFSSSFLYILLFQSLKYFFFSDLPILRIVIYLMGKFWISVTIMSLYLYTSEIYPTEYRHSLLAYSSMFGRIGPMCAPFTTVLVSRNIITLRYFILFNTYLRNIILTVLYLRLCVLLNNF